MLLQSPQFPSALPLEAQLSFGIIVWLPRSSSQRVIKGLKADLYKSALHFGDLSTYIFEAVEFQSSESDVDVEVCAGKIEVLGPKKAELNSFLLILGRVC